MDRGLTCFLCDAVVYNCYDFNETGQVSIDELTLALRSTLTGLCKLSAGVTCPSELTLEDLALHAFHKASKPSPDDFLTLPEFLYFAATTPEMTFWLDYFNCPTGDDDINASDVGDAGDTVDDVGDDTVLPDRPLPAPRHHIDDADPTTETTREAAMLARKRDWSLQLDARAPAFVAAGDDVPPALPLQPWQTVVANATPSAPPTIDPSLPAASLALDWVYGFNSDLRNVVQYISPAEIVYPAGALVVMYDTIEHRQRFARYHVGLVQAIAVHPTNRRVVASGERGAGAVSSPAIAVWNADAPDAAALSIVRGFHTVGIAHLAWMPNGRTLVTIGQDEFQCVAIYQWDQVASKPSSAAPQSSRTSKSPGQSIAWQSPPSLIFTDRCGRAPVLSCIVQSNNQFVTSGARHIFFWLHESTDRYPATNTTAVSVKRRGVLGRRGDAIKTKTLMSLTALPSDPNALLAGTARGHLLVFEGRNCVRVIHAHAAAVNALCAFPGDAAGAGLGRPRRVLLLADGRLRAALQVRQGERARDARRLHRGQQRAPPELRRGRAAVRAHARRQPDHGAVESTRRPVGLARVRVLVGGAGRVGPRRAA